MTLFQSIDRAAQRFVVRKTFVLFGAIFVCFPLFLIFAAFPSAVDLLIDAVFYGIPSLIGLFILLAGLQFLLGLYYRAKEKLKARK